ncbi:hypothetical protein [Vreelandella venusta]|uniref:hypothetical protein n=1 Tax=Vreelandella venusta TaxID=44935 RepID=UPI0011694F59|nr:hypothetical protein [Halomonas venusta]GEK52360.1 hypothetical protein HVE01_30810 [Halomonas venusta]
MTLQDVFDHLQDGELRLLAIGEDGDVGDVESNRHRLIGPINLGLTALHKRFFLRRGEFHIPVTTGEATYVVQRNDLFKIEQVFTPDACELGINDGKPNSILLESYNTLRVPLEVRMRAEQLTVVYRADHPTIDKAMGISNPGSVQLSLPASHMEALLYFVASRLFNPMGGHVEQHEGNNYARKFEMACRELENGGLQMTQSLEQTKFERNGWV